MPTTVTEIETEAAIQARPSWATLLDRFGTAVFAGTVAGFLIGGVGGRLAMLVLRLTSSPGVRGIRSDDDFEIGRFSTETLFLLAVTTILGGMLAVAYLGLRRWLPERRRSLQSAVFFGLVGGALVIHPDGVDFRLLDPLWLAVALFIALPAAFGGWMAHLVERRLGGEHGLRKANVAALVVFGVVGTLAVAPVAVLVIAAVGGLVARRWPGVGRGPVPTWTVRAVLLAVAAVSAVALASDVAEIL